VARLKGCGLKKTQRELRRAPRLPGRRPI